MIITFYNTLLTIKLTIFVPSRSKLYFHCFSCNYHSSLLHAIIPHARAHTRAGILLHGIRFGDVTVLLYDQ